MNKQLVKELANQLWCGRSSLLSDGANREIAPEIVEERESEMEESAQVNRLTLITNCLEERDHKKLQAIDVALDRLAEGQYEVCQECGDEIGAARLRVLPTATLCIDCATKRERESKYSTGENTGMRFSRINFDLPDDS
jgi:RNA polymerase-binding protein DksA